MKLLEKINNQYIYKKENNKWSFYDENNKPIGIEYESIEQAIDALYQYLELIDGSEKLQLSEITPGF